METDRREKAQEAGLKEGARILFSYLKRFKGPVVVTGIFAVVQAVADGVAPFLMGKLFDAILDTETTISFYGIEIASWVGYLLLLSAVWITAGLVGWFVDRKRRAIGTDLAAYYPAQAAARLLKLSVGFFKTEKTGEVVERIQRARNAVSNLMEHLAIGIAPEILSVMIGLTIAFFIHPVLAAVMVAGVVAYIIVLVRLVPPIITLQKAGHKEWRESWGLAMDAAANFQAVKQATAEIYEEERIYDRFINGAAKSWKKVENIWSGITFYQRLLVIITQITLIALAIYFIRIGDLSIGELIALNGYAGMLFGPFVRLGYQWQQLQNGLIDIVHAEEILNLEPERAYTDDGLKLKNVAGEITFENVSFAYPDEADTPVLEDISFSINPGEVIALVGESGAGKSTTIELLSGYYYPNKGSVCIDGADTRDVDLATLRRSVGVVPQEPVLFNDSIEMNIKYGNFDASREEVITAAEQARANVFIEQFPQQYEQLVGERGIKLSTGQKQRIAIARAFLRQPSILVLDEPTSALDAQTEKHITEALEKLMEGRTTFIIAHRLSTVRKANKILVYDQGHIVETGTHDALIQKENGVYRNLYEYQVGLH